MASILLLEDDLAQRIAFTDLLEDDGHLVTQGWDGMKVFDQDILGATDLLVTDLYMPTVDGMQAILSARKYRPELKVIAISGGATYLKHDFLPHMRDFGASAILHKPFAPNEFLETVRTVLATPAKLTRDHLSKALAS
jgi:DNA-binding NtrC family response regulator